MKIEDLKVGRVYRAKRPRVVHTLGGSYINDRQILSISPFEENIQYDSPSVTFGQHWNWKRRKTMTKEELMSAIMGLPAETQVYTINDYADLDHSDGCPLLGVIVVNEQESEPVIYLR